MPSTLYTAYVSSFTYCKTNTDNIEWTNHEDNVLVGVGAKDEEDVKRVIEAWAKSKHREIWQIDDIHPIPRKEFLSPVSKPIPRWKWYEVHGTSDVPCNFRHKRYDYTIIFGYIYAPNKKVVKEKLRQMGVTSIMYIDQGEKYTYIPYCQYEKNH